MNTAELKRRYPNLKLPEPLFGAFWPQYLQTLLRDKVMNTMQICRFVNRRPEGFCRRKLAEEAGLRRTGFNRCKIAGCLYLYYLIHRRLSYLEKDGKIESRKMRWWDDGGPHPDLFRWWYVSEEVFRETILRQTLLYYQLETPT